MLAYSSEVAVAFAEYYNIIFIAHTVVLLLNRRQKCNVKHVEYATYQSGYQQLRNRA